MIKFLTKFHGFGHLGLSELFIEIDQINSGDFEGWVQRNGYMSVRRFRRYPENENHMIVPIERAV